MGYPQYGSQMYRNMVFGNSSVLFTKIFLLLNKGPLCLAVPCWSGCPTNVVLEGHPHCESHVYRNTVFEDNTSTMFNKLGVPAPH